MNCNDINSLDIIEVLKDLEYRHQSKVGSEYMYVAKYRNDTKPSLSINIEKGYWHDFGIGVGGKWVDLLMLVLNKSDVTDIISFCNDRYDHLFSFSQQNTGLQKEKNNGYKITKVFKPIISQPLIIYLAERGISRNSWEAHVCQLHYENQHGKFYAIGFKNDKGGFEIRNRYMSNPICLGSKGITTIHGRIDHVIAFEGFFDFLSFVELKLYTNQTVIVLNTTANIKSGIDMVRTNYSNAKIETYFDNDDSGIKATKEMSINFQSSVNKSDLFKGFNDLNELVSSRKLVKNNELKRPEIRKGMSM